LLLSSGVTEDTPQYDLTKVLKELSFMFSVLLLRSRPKVGLYLPSFPHSPQPPNSGAYQITSSSNVYGAVRFEVVIARAIKSSIFTDLTACSMMKIIFAFREYVSNSI
jgi:hypothetical protein